MKSQTVSVCLVIENEEKHLERCLMSVKNVADEIIVADIGSTDSSLEIAGQYTDKVFEIRWQEDFSRVRNFALNKATSDWILILDGDEELDQQCITALKEKVSEGDSEGYLIKVLNYYQSGNRVEVSPDVVFRLFRNDKAYRFTGVIQEQICGNIIKANPQAKISIAEDICIVHYGYLAEEIIAKNKAARNTRLLENAVQKNPDDLLNRFHLGLEYFQAGQISRALGEFLYVLDKVNLQAIYAPKLMRHVAQCYYLLGDFEDCLNFIENIWMEHFHDQGDLYYLKGLVCRALDRHADAYNAFKLCLDVSAQPAYYANLYCQYKDRVYNQLGEIAEFFTDLETALEYYTSALRENPRALYSLERIVSILNPKDNPDYTVTALNSVFDLTDPGIQLNLGHIFFREEAYILAVKFFDSAMSQEPAPVEVPLVKGLCLMRLKQYQEALAELEKIPPGSSFYGIAQGNMFLCYWLRRHSRKSAECLKNLKAAGTNPGLAEVLDKLRKKRKVTTDELINSEQQVYRELHEIFERLVELGEFERFDEAWNCFAGLYEKPPAKLFGDLYFKYRYYEKAEREYRIALEENITDTETLYRLGKTCWALNNLSEAEKYICAAVELGLNFPRVNRELAGLYQDLAVKTLEEGLAAYPGNQELSVLLKNIKENPIEV
ncbi:TPR domain-containing glycosyltransferase [Phosphitispora fastidiosa]|uniref:TPR domain-containing glycosyltransferase n=1 Tax=Phosphitispora fastidiosa TaxID=2837202 RepID=UPI001E3377C3|nr:TPR domain-containing glycosyltransferase [Phosphitispora fastidiosa]MBU7008484.1 tetratricopeptide (TPR) repeat protein [Phosphitispora fastidiosa]